MLTRVMDLAQDAFWFVWGKIVILANILYARFLSLNIFERVSVAMALLAFLSIIKGMTTYKIFGAYRSLTNPLGVYVIGIVFLMYATTHIPAKIALGTRVVANLYYLFWFILLSVTHSFNSAPYDVTWWFYVNLSVPIIYVALSLLSYFIYEEQVIN